MDKTLAEEGTALHKTFSEYGHTQHTGHKYLAAFALQLALWPSEAGPMMLLSPGAGANGEENVGDNGRLSTAPLLFRAQNDLAWQDYGSRRQPLESAFYSPRGGRTDTATLTCI